jgi:hypothetical protein
MKRERDSWAWFLLKEKVVCFVYKRVHSSTIYIGAT